MCACLLAWALACTDARAADRFVGRVTLEPGLVAVVAEGDLEARSLGSYAVRVYFDPGRRRGDETTFYTAGLLRSRDGTIRTAAPLVRRAGERPLLMVVVQSAGSGGYLAADAFAVEPQAVRLLATVDGLAPNADAAAALRRALDAARH